jgi:hypothetical protein
MESSSDNIGAKTKTKQLYFYFRIEFHLLDGSVTDTGYIHTNSTYEKPYGQFMIPN